MKAFALGCILACGIPMLASADNFNKTADPGVATNMHYYFGWNPMTCQPLSGVVKLLIKPKHGKLTTSQVERAIYRSRFAKGRARPLCPGHAAKAFQIRYTSNPDFHGVDSFTVRATYGWENHVVVDTFTITVP
jgi:hypothetical protein